MGAERWFGSALARGWSPPDPGSALRGMLCPTPPEKLCDARGRPYFLWDNELTLAEFQARLADRDGDIRAYWLGVLLRQARPDDAIVLAGRADIVEGLPRLHGRLGDVEPMWVWLASRWRTHG